MEQLKKNQPLEEISRFPIGILYLDKRMDLCKYGIKESLPFITDALKSNTFVQHFLFGNNISGRSGATLIAQYIQESKNPIKTWYLAGNRFDSLCIETLVKCIDTEPWSNQGLVVETQPDWKIRRTRSLGSVTISIFLIDFGLGQYRIV